MFSFDWSCKKWCGFPELGEENSHLFIYKLLSTPNGGMGNSVKSQIC